MKRMGWFVAGCRVRRRSGRSGHGDQVAARPARGRPGGRGRARAADRDRTAAAELVTREVPPPPDDAVTDAMRDQIGDARMRLREKAEAGVPDAPGGE